MIRQKLFLLLGCTSLGLGFAGMFLPLVPTTPFILLSAFCFSRSSSRLHRWLLAHPMFCSLLLDWERDGAIRPRAKAWSILLMNGFLGYAVFFRETSLSARVVLLSVMIGVPPSSSHVLRRQARVTCPLSALQGLAGPHLSRSAAMSAPLAQKIAPDDFRGTINLAAQVFDRLRHQRDLLACLLPVPLFNRFAHRRKRFDAIASVKSRGIDLVLEPWPVREAAGSRQCPLAAE
jgi:uncharacterized membrane protein YbaN (DUF454 family)